MTSDVDFYRAAALLMNFMARVLKDHATLRALELAQAGDEFGRAVYMRILDAIGELRRGVGRMTR
jgi:hypothetical protein